MARPLLLVVLIASLAGCGGHRHKETARDVEQRVAQKSAGHVTSVTCHRATAKWWDCDVTYEVPQDSLGTSAEEIRAPAR